MRTGRISRTLVIFVFCFLGLEAKDIQVFKRGKIALIDETQFKFPEDYVFEDEDKEPDLENIYDEKVPFLPKFVLHKHGIDQGWTRVPIVTRKGPTWTTLRPPTKRGDTYFTWSTPKLAPIRKSTVPPEGFVKTTTTSPVKEITAVFELPPLNPESEKKAEKVSSEVKTTSSTTPSTTSSTTPSMTSRVKFAKKPSTTSEAELTEESTIISSTTPSTTSSTTPSMTSRVKFAKKPSTSEVELTEESTTISSTPPSTIPSTTSTKISTTEELTTTSESPVSTVSKFKPVFKAKSKFNPSTTVETLFPTKAFTPEFQIDNMIRKGLKTGAVNRAVLPQQRISEVSASEDNGVDVPLPFDPLETKFSNFHFSKFARRFGSIRVVPEKATTKAPVIIASPITVSPVIVVTGQGPVEQKVKSNTLVLRGEQKQNFFLPSDVTVNQNHFSPKTSTTPSPRVIHRWSSSWSSWSSWGPDGKVHTGSTRTFTTFDAPEGTTPASGKKTENSRTSSSTSSPTIRPRITTPRTPSTQTPAFTVTVSSRPIPFRNTGSSRLATKKSPSGRTSFSHQGIMVSSQVVSLTGDRRTHSRTNPSSEHFLDRKTSRPRVLKPPVIHPSSGQRYRGPTYNCRILTPEKDGRPSAQNDFTCPLKYPGFPADETCKCTYQVEGRDEHGCATGFLYTCFKKN